MKNSTPTFDTFQGKAKMKISANNRTFNANGTVRIQRNEVIWVSLTSFLSMEVARIKITPERVQIINRLNRSYIDQPFTFIYKYAGNDISYAELESIFFGTTPSFIFNAENFVFKTTTGYQVIGAKNTLDFELIYDEKLQLQSNALNDSVHHQALKLSYGEFQEYEKQNLPSEVAISVNGSGTALRADIEFSDISLNGKMSTPFSIPDNYKEIDIR